MKKLPIFIFIVWLFSVNAFAQQAKHVDTFEGYVNCGLFMAKADNIYILFKNSPENKIYLIYYGGRYRKEKTRNKKNKDDRIQLKYPHREDGLKWAKSIPLYLTTFKPFPKELREEIKDNIVLINGGFRENTEVEIWIGQEGDKPPIPTPTIAETDIIFRKDKPSVTPNYTQCYGGHYN